MSINFLNGELANFHLFRRHEVPSLTNATSSTFFTNATGTTVSGPAHFANNTGNQYIVINRECRDLDIQLQLIG